MSELRPPEDLAPPSSSPLEVVRLGKVSYLAGIGEQEQRAEQVKHGNAPQALFLLEHSSAVITVGRNAKTEHILFTEAELRERNIELHHCSRGGDVTYHGPGQLVAYSVLDLSRRKDLGGYLRALEEVILRTLNNFGVAGERVPGLTGVWVGGSKVAAIGVHASRWVTTHGIALNVSPSHDHFATIVPCGIRERGVTSLAELLENPPRLEEVAERYAQNFRAVFADHFAAPHAGTATH